MSYLSNPPSAIGGSPGLSVTVGPPTANYPITSTAAAGGAAATINKAIAAVNAANGGTVWILGGAGTTYWTEATIELLESVNIYMDGCIIEAMDGAAFSPVIGNPTTETLTDLIFDHIALNANGARSGYTAISTSVTSGTAWTNPLEAQTCTLTSSGGTISSVTINGLTFGTTGPWYVTPTDSIVIDYTGSPAFTYTPLIDGIYCGNAHGCSWRDCGPLEAGTTSSTPSAGVAFCLDSFGTTNTANNKVSIHDSTTAASDNWTAAIRLNGASGGATTDGVVEFLAFPHVLYRGIDIATNADTWDWGYCYVQGPSATDYFVGAWIGSGGSSATNAAVQRQHFHFLVVNAAGSDATGIAIGYYTPSSEPVVPALIVDNWMTSTAADYTNRIIDLRATPVFDWTINDVNVGLQYNAQSTDGNLASESISADGSTTICTLTPIAAGLYEVGGNYAVTVAGSVTLSLQVTFNDIGGASETLTLPLSPAGGTTLVYSTTSTGFWAAPSFTISAHKSDAITVSIVATSYSSSATVNASGFIRKVAGPY